MAFKTKNFALLAENAEGVRLWQYQTSDDALAAVIADDYFPTIKGMGVKQVVLIVAKDKGVTAFIKTIKSNGKIALQKFEDLIE